MKVWCFNCFGVCVGRMEVSKIHEWNQNHPNYTTKICDWKE